MDPQSQSFTPYSTNNDTWRLQTEVTRIQQIQGEHSERIARLERRQDEDARMKSVWGNSSGFPGVLSGTPQQGAAPLQQPPSDQFRNFDDEANNLMSSLHLDVEDEPRRGMSANSRANSVRFDETANQNHFSHSSRPSMDFMSRTSSGLGGLQMTERTASHKSEGRASSVHSIRSAASGRANSLNLDTTYGLSDPNRSPLDHPGLAPGLALLGSVPAIIRCWMNTNFKHDALLYAAVCTGSYKSFLDLRLIQKLGFEDNITTNAEGARTVELPVYFPEAVPHPVSSRSSSPAPQLPTVTVNFQLVDEKTSESDKSIQIFLGSDTLRAHNADVLFSSNTMTLFDDDRSKLCIPLVRPENETSFNSLFITSGTHQTSTERSHGQAKDQTYINGLGQGSSGASVSSAAASPPPGKYRPPGVIAAETGSLDSTKAGAAGSDSDARPSSQQSTTSRPSLSLLNTRDSQDQPPESGSHTTPLRSGSSPAIWSNWRRDGGTSATTPSSNLDWASAGKSRENSYQRKDTGIKVLKPKTASRTVSTTAATSASASSPADGKSRFFDDGRRRSELENKPIGGEKKENQTPAPASSAAGATPKTKANPIGGASAFAWLNSGGSKALPRVAELERTFATASSQKKRKLAPFASIDSPAESTLQLYDENSLSAHARSSPSSSPRPTTSDAPSPASSDTTRQTTPPRFLPPHLHEEVLLGKESAATGQEGTSPSGAFAEITIDSGSSGDMSGSENGSNTTEQRQVVSPGRVLGARSASPAKRSAADMEGGDKSGDGGGGVPGSFTKGHDDGSTDFDQAMAETTQNGDAMDAQDTAADSVDTSAQGSMTTNTSATSFQEEEPPPYSAEDSSPPKPKISTDYTTAEIDIQESLVRQKSNKPLDEGQKGVVVSNKWLVRVLARSSEGLKNNEHPKEAREGLIGPVDNSDIVADGAFKDPLHDMEGRNFIPLKPGLTQGTDFEVFNDEAWGVVVGAYGTKDGQCQIDRYAHNTADADAAGTNIMYEVYPPVFTIRKVLPPGREHEQGQSLPPATTLSALRLKAEQRHRGQSSPDDALQLVSSRHERFQKFLARSKEATGIERSSKVKVWKLLDPTKVTVDKPDSRQNGVLSPPASRSASPKPSNSKETKLVLDSATFEKMEIGKDLEPVDAKDETNNSNYNGTSNLLLYVLVENETLLLEECIDGPAGGEFVSDKKKRTNKFSLVKNGGSKPGSTAPSGRSSPAPGGGMMTRGRARRDGRTRGTVGLTNLGNTCYMNSALQCIRSVEELAVYFLSEKYKKEINTSNPLGHGGVMAKQYANVLNNIYADNAGGAVTPSAFKKTLGSMQPMFSGYGQQDSQEFLSFLVDALHEDLNRIIKKPYNENPDSDDKTVHDPQAIIELGETYRTNHKARNDSVAMDLFSGFYKNTMECPVCDKISITFDPYSLLTVQLPIENTFQHTVTFVPLRGKPVNHMIDIDKNSTIKMLKEYIASKHAGVQADRLWMAEVYSHKIYKVFENTTTLGEAGVQTNDYLFVFELEDAPSNPPQPPEKKSFYTTWYSNKADDKVPDMDDPKADRFSVPIFSRQKNRFGSGWDMVLHPMYITVTREEAQDFEVILKKVLIAVSRMTSMPILSENDENTGEESSAADEMDKDDAATEPNAQVNDTSSSEDGYVNVSVNKPEQADDSETQANGTAANGSVEDDRPAPARFMDSQYFISPVLRNQLFGVNYAQSDGGMHCSSMSSIQDKSVRNMFDRVKLPVRRGSTQSTSSGEESTTSTDSGAQANGELEKSDADEMDKPDMVIGNESYLSMPTPTAADDSGNEWMADTSIPTSRKGRRKHGKGKKNRRGNMQTYSKKGKQGQRHNRPNSSGSLNSQRSLGAKWGLQDDNPFYIKLGEGIVLDWYPESFQHLFGGSRDDPDEVRGHFVSHPDGKGLPYVKDPEVEAKKSRREARKKNGITLEDCFVETGKREVLSEDNAWYCNRCKERRRAAKTLEIWTIPDILVVHLKRFGGNRSFRDKIDVFVDYPIDGLDMTQKVGLKEDGKEYVYDLFAVDNHFGGLGGGHYTAMAKNFYDGQWYDYNDSSTSKLGESRLHSAAAYLLFYRRRSENPLGPPELQELVLEFRNPQQTESAAEETAEESDSGEGRLGGLNPNGSKHLHGSSSNLTGAGVGAENRSGSRAGGAGALLGVGSNLTRRMDQDEGPINEIQGSPVYGPARPPYMLEYGNQGAPQWNFDGINTATAESEADDAVGRLINNVDDEDDDAGSTTAEMDTTDDYAFESRMDDVGFSDAQEFNDWSAGHNTPNSTAGWDNHDDHGMYSDAHEQQDVLHLEDAGMTGEEDEFPTVNIYPDPPTP